MASVLFPNPQSLFDGVRVGFVNPSSGNLTFRRRDLVARAQGPVVFARVYDSRIAANADLGPGWRLSLAEEILVDGDAAVHVDASGARHAFARNGTAWAPSPPTPRHAGTTLSFADAGGVRTAALADGEAVRAFAQADASGARYVLASVRTAARELAFGYADGRLASVSHDGDVLLRVERDADGRIAAVRDGHGRSVRHFYDADGRLATVRDLAGSDWAYRYGDDGLLADAVDPEGRTYLAADHDEAGRVVRAFADGRLHDYAYAADGTTVTEDAAGTHALTRNAAGVTTALESTTGASWSATLDAGNRVSTLALPERTMNYAYGAHGRVASMTVADAVSGTTRMHSYGYDAQGRLVSATGGGADATVTYAAGLVRIEDGAGVFEYEVDDRGRVAWVRQGTKAEVRVERDQAGDVVGIAQGHRSVRFGRDDLGRIVNSAFADGSSTRYSYDELGNRTLAEHSDGRSVDYQHDEAGRLASVETTERDGTVRLETARPPADLSERFAFGEVAALEAEYLQSNAAGSLEAGGESSGLEDDRRSLFAAMRHVLPDPAPEHHDASVGPFLAAVMGRSPDRRQPDYGAAGFGSELGATGPGLRGFGVPDLAEAEVLPSASRRLFDAVAAESLDHPAYLVFMPSEYTAVATSTTDEDSEGSDACPTACSFEVAVEPGSPAISEVPAMPTVTATASEIVPSGATVSWSARIAYDPYLDPERCSDDATTSYDSGTVTGTRTSFSPDFGGIYGGKLTITATCSAEGREDNSVDKTVTIDGTQPTTAAVAADLATPLPTPFDGADLRRIACLESGLTQFRPSPGPPYLGGAGDAGIMQICYRRTRADLWNWKSNIARGRGILIGAKQQAELYLEDLVFNSGATRPTDHIWRLESIHRYNAGTGADDRYWVWIAATDDNPGKWMADPRGGAKGYVDLVLAASCP